MLIQQVNLYQRSTSSDSGRLPPSQMAGALAAFVVVLALASAWVVTSGWLGARALSALEAELAERQAAVLALEAELRTRLDPQTLEAKLDALAQSLAQKQRVLEVLGGESLANDSGFSDALHGFSRRVVHGLWLRGFELRDGGRVVTLRGSALHPAGIPEFLARLGDEPAFAGMEFDQFVLERSQTRTGAVDFTLSNAAPEAP